jgi:hypothetical protein
MEFTVETITITETNKPESIKGRVRMIMREYGFKSQTQLASSLDIEPATISMWIKRAYIPPGSLIRNLPFINPDFIKTGQGEVRIK